MYFLRRASLFKYNNQGKRNFITIIRFLHLHVNIKTTLNTLNLDYQKCLLTMCLGLNTVLLRYICLYESNSTEVASWMNYSIQCCVFVVWWLKLHIKLPRAKVRQKRSDRNLKTLVQVAARKGSKGVCSYCIHMLDAWLACIGCTKHNKQ